MNSTAVDFGNRVRSQREYKQLSQTQLAKIISKTQAYVSLVETGNCMPTKEVANKFAQALDVNVNYLFGKRPRFPLLLLKKKRKQSPSQLYFLRKMQMRQKRSLLQMHLTPFLKFRRIWTICLRKQEISILSLLRLT